MHHQSKHPIDEELLCFFFSWIVTLDPIEVDMRSGLFGDLPCLGIIVLCATAVGLRHPISHTQALTKYRESLYPFRSNIIAVCQNVGKPISLYN